MPAVKKNAESIGIRQVFNKLVKEIGSPVDFELPESFNKWKPTSYSFIRRTHQLDLLVFVVKIASAEFMTWTNKYLILIGTSVSCYSMLMSSCSSGCKCGSSCVNKPFQQRPMKKMKTVLFHKCFVVCSVLDFTVASQGACFLCWKLRGDYVLLNLAFLRDLYAILTLSSSAYICLLINATFSKLKCLFQTEKCGMGVVAEEDINQGEFVIEYVGEVIDDKTCEERLWKMKHSGETNFYLCEINRDMVIDATYKGNKSRYINHSCSPNTEMQKWMIDGETRIGIFATRDIKKGEHLTYDYQFVQFGADQDCYCGAAGCRKKLGVKPNKPKAPFSDAALRIAASQMDANSPEVKAVVSNKPVYMNGVPGVGGPRHNPSQQKKRRLNCIGSVIRIFHFSDKSSRIGLQSVVASLYAVSVHIILSFGIIRRFDNTRRKHLIMFEDGYSEFLDLAKEEWEFCNC
ncbi:Histone-lysine N-methyltransferase ASHH3 [Sesamum angolense]|uniref:Histone-lysine N-methyltransferase ASHH3 n=1 Tax=Sesamum angolense TaxID=2727404 RepID=A0AAE1XAE4_9LAMI|nr:Histone-lysine N-methyltransferase ASHH3 [Sesamum angolense]